RGDPARPAGHVVVEATEIDREPALLRPANDVAHRLVVAVGITVGRETHHLALAAPGPEAEVVGDGGVDEPERVRQADRMQPLDAGAATPPEPRRDVLPRAIHRENGGLLDEGDNPGAVEEGDGGVVAVGAEAEEIQRGEAPRAGIAERPRRGKPGDGVIPPRRDLLRAIEVSGTGWARRETCLTLAPLRDPG